MADYALEGPKWGSSLLGTAGGTITWAIDSSVPANFIPVLTAAFSDWAHNANIQFQQVSSTVSSLIDIGLGAIDGLNGTLGVTNYSYSQTSFTSAAIKFDTGENWHASGTGVVSDGGANLFLTALHEIGHAIGLDHYNAAPAVMNAVLTRSVTDLTSSDLDGVHALYGLPATSPAASVETTLFGTIAHDANSSAGKVYALYEGLLGRAPDPLGGEGFAAALTSGASLRDLTQSILSSPEARSHLNAPDNAGFVEQLYETVLGRPGDAGGVQGWANALNAGTSRADVANSFVFSTEHLSQLQGAYAAGVFVPDAIDAGVARLYYGLLGRAPDAAGLQAFEAAARAVGADQGLLNVAAAIVSSAEFMKNHAGQTNAAYVDSLYVNALGRHADTGGQRSSPTNSPMAVAVPPSPWRSPKAPRRRFFSSA